MICYLHFLRGLIVDNFKKNHEVFRKKKDQLSHEEKNDLIEILFDTLIFFSSKFDDVEESISKLKGVK